MRHARLTVYSYSIWSECTLGLTTFTPTHPIFSGTVIDSTDAVIKNWQK
jgi:hypothetical protein